MLKKYEQWKTLASHTKGANSERELVKLFLEAGWQSLRIAGSGKMNLAPDIIAGTKGRLLVIECKSRKNPVIYIDQEEVSNVIQYAEKFGAEPWYGLRFNYKEWFFVKATELQNTKKILPDSGVSFQELIK